MNFAITFGVMAAVWLTSHALLARAFGEGIAIILISTVIASAASTLALSRLSRRSDASTLAPLVSALQKIKNGDYGVRAAVSKDEPLVPLAAAINEVAAHLSDSVEGTKKRLELVSGILDGMLEGVIVFNREGSIVLANLAARKLAVTQDELLGKSAIEALRIASLAEAVSRTLRNGESAALEVDTKGVPPRRLIVRTSPRTDRPGGVIVVLHDVTDLRRLEAIRTDLVANVSHELRTPVTAITTAVETLQAGALDDAKDAAEFVEMIERNAARLRRLVDDILDLSKIEGKAYKLNPETMDLLPLVSQAQKLVQDVARRRKIAIKTDVATELMAAIDRHAFEQVLGNLLDNAVKYAGDGASVAVTGREEGEFVFIHVADTGAGIAPHHLDRLFERFYRVDAGRSREMGGTGLGLSIVKHLMEAMGGAVSVKSTLGKGTTFTLELPRNVRERESPTL